jgi:diadenosine tetraphosphatase ApaH/serine/threonine PP2A family protein phosphatase
MGNHDRMVATGQNFHGNNMARAGVTHAKNTITDGQREWLASLPTELFVADDAIKIVHGHPADPDHYTRPGEFSASLLGRESVLVMGHTHVQYHETYPEGTVMNPGSVGQPRDGDPRAAYSVVSLPSGMVEEHRVSYDIEAVITAIETAGLPHRTGTRLRKGH